ncbi:MAG: argininosuccinate lyase [Phycisphaerales bacterium]|nr:argininosuccinate lyase [Phycisphaerales bacterium]
MPSKNNTPPKKSWQARIGAAQDALAVQFVESLSFDHRLAKHDILGSIAHATMLHSVGLLTATDLSEIKRGLNSILADIQTKKFHFDISQEDIHMAIEAALIKLVGEPGRKLHTARSRNDQVALDIRLWCREAISLLTNKISDLQRTFIKMATEQGHHPMPSFTHLQRAQPIVAGHEMLAWCEMLQRDKDRLADCSKRVNISPLGAGAVGGSTLPIDRAKSAAFLNMPEITHNSLDSISDRDFLCELAFDLSMIAMHLSRWAEQWILYVTTEFGFMRIADAFTTGSSMMPQKRNPDMLELIRGKTGGVYGQLLALLTMMKAQPLAYNRDMQEDKRSIFFAYDTVDACLTMAAAIVLNTTLLPDRIADRLDEGFADATVMAEYLVRKGIPFRTAHHIVGSLVADCEKKSFAHLGDLDLTSMQEKSPLIDENIYRILGANKAIQNYKSHGAGGLPQLKTQLKRWHKLLTSTT